MLGYSPVGGAITGPRDSAQNSFEEQDSLSWVNGAHSMKCGGELLRTRLNMFQGIAPNAFFIFASTFPTNNAVANLELGAPVTCYQGLGDFHRGLRDWSVGAYAHDEWRLTSRFTLNYGLRYESVQPITEVKNRLNGLTPFTVCDSTNVSLQANSPPISGYPASRPNLISDPNSGSHGVQDWMNPAAFERLNPVTQTGQFGNADRDIARGPAFTDFDASLIRTFRLRATAGLEFRAELFNIANHANFGLPVADLNSPNFGQILTANAPRLMQFALELMF